MRDYIDLLFDFLKLNLSNPENLLESPYEDVQARSGITYNTTHVMLDNTGPDIVLNRDINIGNIMDSLRECKENKTCDLTEGQLNNIYRSLISDNLFTSEIACKDLHGVFVHDPFKGLVFIKKDTELNDLVASISVKAKE